MVDVRALHARAVPGLSLTRAPAAQEASAGVEMRLCKTGPDGARRAARRTTPRSRTPDLPPPQA